MGGIGMGRSRHRPPRPPDIMWEGSLTTNNRAKHGFGTAPQQNDNIATYPAGRREYQESIRKRELKKTIDSVLYFARKKIYQDWIRWKRKKEAFREHLFVKHETKRFNIKAMRYGPYILVALIALFLLFNPMDRGLSEDCCTGITVSVP